MRVVLYAPYRELAAERTVEIPSAEAADMAQLLAALALRFPRLAPLLQRGASHEDPLMVVINGRLADRQAPLATGDQVELRAHIGGG